MKIKIIAACTKRNETVNVHLRIYHLIEFQLLSNQSVRILNISKQIYPSTVHKITIHLQIEHRVRMSKMNDFNSAESHKNINVWHHRFWYDEKKNPALHKMKCCQNIISVFLRHLWYWRVFWVRTKPKTTEIFHNLQYFKQSVTRKLN